MIKATVILPSRNRHAWASKALSLVKSQVVEGIDLSCVLVDATSFSDRKIGDSSSVRDLEFLWSTIDSMRNLQIVILPGATCGYARNAGCEKAIDCFSPDYLVHWNDDDWYASERVVEQVSWLERNRIYGMHGCGRSFAYEPATGRAFDLDYDTGWAPSGSWVQRTSFWLDHRFHDTNADENSYFTSYQASRPSMRFTREHAELLVSMFHDRNSEHKELGTMRSLDRSVIEELIGDDLEYYSGRNFLPVN